MNKFSKNIILLSLISLFGDIASELLYPVLPLYLKSIGMGAVYIGILEGVADFISGISKTVFGKWSDRLGKRMPFVTTGYVLSSFSKAFVGLFVNPFWVLFTRSMDRLGKGIRTSSRDAILSMEATPETKGAVFGFHRAFDTTGAFIGPILALIYLKYFPGKYRELFLYSLIPAIFVVLILFFVKEKRTEGKNEKGSLFITSFKYWGESTSEYKQVVLLILSFTLVNSSDMFLLLQTRSVVDSDWKVIFFYILYNFVYAITSYPIGILSDKIGKKKIFSFGLICFSATYLMVGFAHEFYHFVIAFVLYGLFASCTEGVSKAWISSLCKEEDLGVALGFQNTTQSVCALIASLLAGLIWQFFGAQYLFLFSGVSALIIAFIVTRKKSLA